MPLLCAILISANVFTFVLLMAAVQGGGFHFAGDMKTMDVATIALTAATLVVAVVGVIVAVVAFIGYREIRAASIKAAREAASKTATDVATSVATRVALDTRPSDTEPGDAEEIARKA